MHRNRFTLGGSLPLFILTSPSRSPNSLFRPDAHAMLLAMDRVALFVDGAYAVIAGGSACLGVSERRSIDCEVVGLTSAFCRAATSHCSEVVLRSYWYDASESGSPETLEHRELSAHPGVDLRLGRLVQHQQKGVDVLLAIDLFRLALRGAISTAYILAGDADIEPSVQAAKREGVRVVLIGIPESDAGGQSSMLIESCDDYLPLGIEHWRPHFRLREAMPRPSISAGSLPPAMNRTAQAHEFGRRYGITFINEANDTQIAIARERAPAVPLNIDSQMMRSAEEVFGPLRTEQALRVEVRQGFLSALVDFNGRRPDGPLSSPSPLPLTDGRTVSALDP